MTVVRRWVATAVVVPLLVAGCSDDPQPKFEPSPSPSQSESASEPAEPMAWEVKSEKGAVAFAKHWIDVFNEATNSGDSSPMRSVSAPACGTCSRFADGIDDLYEAGGAIESEGWVVQQAVPAEGLTLPQARVALRIKQTPQEISHGNGRVESFPGGQETFSARLVWSNSQWLMSDLVLIR